MFVVRAVSIWNTFPLNILCKYNCWQTNFILNHIGVPPASSWSSWSRFGSCTTTCGQGVRTSTRACRRTGCVGHHIRNQVCTQRPCDKGNEWFYILSIPSKRLYIYKGWLMNKIHNFCHVETTTTSSKTSTPSSNKVSSTTPTFTTIVTTSVEATTPSPGT